METETIVEEETTAELGDDQTIAQRLKTQLETLIEAVKGGAADEIAEALADSAKLAAYAQTVFDREAEL